MRLHKAHSVQGLVACTLCAFPREANTIASVSRTSIVDHLVGSEGRFVPPAAAAFPDGVGASCEAICCCRDSH